jgi:hypothetical protein
VTAIVRELPLVPAGCGLSPDGLAEQLRRVERLRPAAAAVERDGDELCVSFTEAVDHGLVEELVATERSCCSFLGIEYDRRARLLRLDSGRELRGRDVLETLEASFRTGEAP